MLCIISPSHELALLELHASNIAFSRFVRHPDFKKSTILCLESRVWQELSYCINSFIHNSPQHAHNGRLSPSNLLGYLRFSLTRLNHSIFSVHNHCFPNSTLAFTSIYSCLVKPSGTQRSLKPALLNRCYLWASTSSSSASSFPNASSSSASCS